MLTISFLALLAIGQVATGLLIYLESRRTGRTDQKLFAILSFTLVLWTVAVGFLVNIDSALNASNIEYFRFANKAAFMLTCAALVAFYIFSFEYPFKRRYTGASKIVAWSGVGLTLASAIPFFSGNLTIDSLGFKYTYGPGVILIALFALVVLASVYANEYSRSRRTKNQKLRKQTSTLLTGMTLTIAHTLLFVIVLPSLLGQDPLLYALGYAGPYYLTGYTAYGLLQQGLFDVRLIVARSMGYILTIAVLSGLYGFIVFGLADLLFDLNIPLIAQFFLSLATGFAALSFQAVKRFFDKTTNRFFYQDAYNPELLFDEFNKVLVSTIDLHDLLTRASGVISTHLKAAYCTISIPDKAALRFINTGSEDNLDAETLAKVWAVTLQNRRPVLVADQLTANRERKLHILMDRSGIGLVAKLTTDYRDAGEGLGMIILGPKKSGNPYNSQDTKVMETIANELIIAMQNALRFEEIERFNETLQRKVEDATRKLRDTNRQLKKLNDTKDDFIGMASHQLRTPLTAIKGYISLVMDGDAGKVTETQRKLLQQAFTSSQKMVYLVADLLNVSRLKTGKFVIERSPTDLAKLVGDEIAQLKEEALGRKLELTYRAPKDFPLLPLDETKTRQVVMNFLDNAIYYTPSGGHVRAELEVLDKSIEFRVVDDGIGVPSDEHFQLWQKFYRAKNAQRARPDGTGLGLYMASKVITAQGGATIFKSEEGKGSTFGFSFPKDLPLEQVQTPARSRP